MSRRSTTIAAVLAGLVALAIGAPGGAAGATTARAAGLGLASAADGLKASTRSATPHGLGALARAAGTCSGRLPLAVRLPTSNARSFARLGFVRVIAAARVRDVRVVLERDGRKVAEGARAGPFAGGVTVRLTFRRVVRAGRTAVVATGRRAGCAAKRTARRAVTLDRRDLPVALSAADRDVRDGRFALTLRRTAAQPVADLRVRVLDRSGATVAEQARAEPLGAPLRLEFEPRERLAAGRYWVLATATVRGETLRSAVAAAIDLGGDPVPVADPPAGPGPPPAPGAVVRQVAVSWSHGRWEGADSAAFALPGIGEGRLVCRPDTQWLRVFPSDRARDVAMMLWTFRDWEGGREGALREAQMTPFTGPDFNEGFNKFTPSEKRSQGTFTGVVGDGLPAAGFAGAGRSPVEVRVSWSWDFEDPAGARCSVAATVVSEGSGADGPVARGLSLAWNGESGAPAELASTTVVPGLGVVRLRCDPRPEGVRRLTLEPEVAPAGLTVTTREGSEVSERALSEGPVVVELPNNGLVELQAPGGTRRVLLASRWKVNDPDPAQNSCRLWGVAISAGS